MRWEYHCEELVYEPDGTPDETLNQLGEQGWELVSVVDTGTVETDTGFNYFAFMFKRPKANPLCDSTKIDAHEVPKIKVKSIYLMKNGTFGVFSSEGFPCLSLQKKHAIEVFAEYAELNGYSCEGAVTTFQGNSGVVEGVIRRNASGDLVND